LKFGAASPKEEFHGKQENSCRTGSAAMYRVQAQELYYQKEPPEYPGKAGI
jgi:hypothetical protein